MGEAGHLFREEWGIVTELMEQGMAEGSIKRIHMPLFIDLYLGSLHQIYDSRATVKHQLPLESRSPLWTSCCSGLPQRNGRSLEIMHWLYLSLAILFEVAGTLNMKLSEGFSKPPSVSLVVFYICLELPDAELEAD